MSLQQQYDVSASISEDGDVAMLLMLRGSVHTLSVPEATLMVHLLTCELEKVAAFEQFEGMRDDDQRSGITG